MAEIEAAHPKEVFQLEVMPTNGGSVTLNLKSKARDDSVRFAQERSVLPARGNGRHGDSLGQQG